MNILEVGIIGNGTELVRVSTDESMISSDSQYDFRAALLHAILVYHRSYTDCEISYFAMKNSQVFLSTLTIDGGDLIFYAIVKAEKQGIIDLIYNKNSSNISSLKPRFSNLKNKYLQILGEKIPADMSRFKSLENVIMNIFRIKKK
jgi:hypothetical protein